MPPPLSMVIVRQSDGCTSTEPDPIEGDRSAALKNIHRDLTVPPQAKGAGVPIGVVPSVGRSAR